MKRVRMFGCFSAILVCLAVGCKSDDDPVVNGDGSGGASGNASGTTGGNGSGGQSGANTTPEADSGSADMLPSIAGMYSDGFETHTISSGLWRIDTSAFHITILNNAQEYLVASNDANNPWNNDGKWSRFDWTRTTTGDLYYCQTAYNAESEQQAANTARPDTQDLAKGCGSFSWTKLTPLGSDAGM